MARLSPGKAVRYAAETAGVLAAYAIFRALPIDWASGLGGFLGRTIGPRLGLSRRARRNLALAMPELSEAEIERIVAGMWDNLGRVAGETPHVPRLDPLDGSGRIEIIGMEHAEEGLRAGAAIVFSGHLANWELLPATAYRLGFRLELIYRAANNPWIDQLVQNTRLGDMSPKGAQGARSAVSALKSRRPLGLLVDQKMNDGIAAPFFGRPAMTAPALVDLARKFKAPCYPVRLERLKGARFRITVLPAMRFEAGPDRHADLAAGMARVNAVLESWIRDKPEQWLWLHRRWPES